MKIKSISLLRVGLLLAILASITITGCKKKGCTDPNARNYDPDAKKDDGTCVLDDTYSVPTSYNFSNVSYSGQTVRLLLLEDLTNKISEASIPEHITYASLYEIYDHTSDKFYSDIATGKNLQDKVSSSKIDSAILNYFTQIDSLSNNNKGFVSDLGIDLQQTIEKILMGSIFYYQALEYLDKVPGDDNNTVTAGKGTDMEHHWDEAFGYFGAARDFNSYTDAEIKTTAQKDSDNDGTIDPESERCLYFAKTAAKRDFYADNTLSGTDFTKTIFDAFLTGRAAITNSDYTVRDKAITTIKENWDIIIAATVIHYVNKTKDDITNNGVDLNKHWAEGKNYLNMLSYYTETKLVTSNIDVINGYFGDKPADATRSTLDAAISLIQKRYDFSDDQASRW